MTNEAAGTPAGSVRWIKYIIIVAIVVALVWIVWRAIVPMASQPLGDCMRSDTSAVLATDVTRDRCDDICPDGAGACPWVQN